MKKQTAVLQVVLLKDGYIGSVYSQVWYLCVYIYGYLYTQCGASTLCSLSPTHTLYRDPCSSNGLNGHCELLIMSCLC